MIARFFKEENESRKAYDKVHDRFAGVRRADISIYRLILRDKGFLVVAMGPAATAKIMDGVGGEDAELSQEDMDILTTRKMEASMEMATRGGRIDRRDIFVPFKHGVEGQ